MSLIIHRNFKRANAQDAVERNAASDELNVGDKIWITQYGRNYPYTITKKWKEGWTVWYKAKNDKSGKEEIVAGAFANALDAADSSAADAKFKKGDKVRRGKQTGIVRDIEKEPYIEVKFTDQPVTVFVHESEIVAADSRAADACGKGEDAENFSVGQKVKHTRFGTIGKVFEIAPDGAIGVQWGNGQAYYGKFHKPLSEIVAVNE